MDRVPNAACGSGLVLALLPTWMDNADYTKLPHIGWTALFVQAAVTWR